MSNGPWYQIELSPRVPDLLYRIQDLLDDPLDQALDEIADGVTKLYQDTATSVGAVLSGRFRDTIHVREATRAGDIRERLIASDVPYSGVIEYGWIYRGYGQASYPGRHVAQITVDRAGPVVDSAFDHQMSRLSFGRAHA